jgi:hypothetical protein
MAEKIKITGNVIEKNTKPLEYATVTVINSKAKKTVAGGITNQKENLILMYPQEFIPLKLSLF